MQPKILKTEEEYESALEIVSELMDANPGSPEEDSLDLWSLLVEKYEDEHYPIDPPDPIEAIKFRMDQMGWRQKDLAQFFPGDKTKVSDVLHRRRTLSLKMIRALNQHLGIPTDVLVREVSLARKAPKGRPAKKVTARTTGAKRLARSRSRTVTSA